MKTKIPNVRLFLLVTLLLAVEAVSIASINWVGSYVSVNNTTYDSATNTVPAAFSYAQPNLVVCLSNNLARVTDVNVYEDLSLDGINWTNAAAWSPTSTNSGSYTWSPGTLVMSVFARIRVVDTNQNYLAVFQP